MEAYIYTNKDDNRKINKNIINEVYIPNVDFRHASSIYDLSIVVPTSMIESYHNYVFIPRFTRYYYVVDFNVEAGFRHILNCKVDPLMSFKDEILELDVSIERNEFLNTPDLGDPFVPLEMGNTTEIARFSQQPFNAGSGEFSFVLCVKGG